MFNENNLLYQLLLTTRQKTELRSTFENNMSTDVKLPKAQMSKIIQFGVFLGSLLSKIAGPLMKVAVPPAKNILALLGFGIAAPAIVPGIQKKMHVPSITTLIIYNKEMNSIMKLLKL